MAWGSPRLSAVVWGSHVWSWCGGMGVSILAIGLTRAFVRIELVAWDDCWNVLALEDAGWGGELGVACLLS